MTKDLNSDMDLTGFFGAIASMSSIVAKSLAEGSKLAGSGEPPFSAQ